MGAYLRSLQQITLSTAWCPVLLASAMAAALLPDYPSSVVRGGEAPAKDGKPWEVVSMSTAWVAVPTGWREIRSPNPRMVLFRQGDFAGLPAVDEKGAPLQAGLTVEKYPDTKDTPKEGAEAMARGAKGTRGLELVGKEKLEAVTLGDGTEAALLTMEFIKGGTRRSLQMKLLAKDKTGNGWVVSGYVVAGKDSKLPTPDSEPVQWVREHVTSFCFEKAKLDEDKLKKAHARYGKARP